MKLSSGTQIAHYRVTGVIGTGGNGTVYLADDLSLKRQVAIKFLKSSSSHQPEEKEQLLEEARATAQQNHPSLVTIYDVGTYHDMPYLVLEYVDGTPLNELLKAGPLAPARIQDLVSQLCEGLQAAHESGIVHGDIKPSNIMVDRKGRVRILDFGVSRLLDSPGTIPDSSLSGTIRYMAPEVLTGRPPDARSDLFSVGVLLYQMQSGKLPFSGSYDAAVMYAIGNHTPVPLVSLVPDLSPELAAITDQLLEKDPAHRFGSAESVRHALGAIRGGSHKPKLGWRTWAALAAAFAGVVFITWYLISDRPPATDERMMLAVLPFVNMGAPGDEYFADGVTDAVTNQLANVDRLGVISRHSAMLYKDSHQDLPSIGEELGVDYLVTGSIHWEREANDSLRINVALVKPPNDLYFWSATYDSDLDQIFKLHAHIAADVAGALRAGDGQAEDAAQPTVSLAAYDLYLRGNDFFYRSWEQSDIEFAGSLYRRSIDLDSTFAAAHAMLSRVDASMFWERYDPSKQRCSAAFAAAEKALELDADLAAGFLALGYCYYHCNRDFDSALKQLQTGLVLHPGHSDLHNAIAAVRRRQGKLTESLQGFTEALRLDPRSHLKAFDVGLTLGMLRRYPEAKTYLDRTVLLAPDYALAHIYRAWLPVLSQGDTTESRRMVQEAMAMTDLTRSRYYWWLLRILQPGGDSPGTLTAQSDTTSYYLFRSRAARAGGRSAQERIYADSARLILEPRVARQPDDAHYQSALGIAYAGLHQMDSALAHGRRAVDLLPNSREAFDAPFLLLNLAEILTVFGQADQAIERLELVMSIPGFASEAYLRLDPLWEPLRAHPRFQQLLVSYHSESPAEIP
jgi:TolB-like protein/Flp pilus assembly protein TadD